MKKTMNFLGLFIVIGFTCLVLTATSSAAFKNVKLGETAPKFKLKEIGHKKSVALEDYFGKNKVIVLVFWSTWSPRSQKELKDIKALRDEYKAKGVEVIAVNVEKEEATSGELNKMEDIRKALGIDYKMVLDAGLDMFHDYGVVAVPSTVLLDSNGVILKTFDGYPTSAKLDMKIDIEVILGIREPAKEVDVAAVKAHKIAKKAKLHYGLGRKLIERGMGSKAVRELEKSAKLDEKYDLPLIQLGEVYESEYRRVRRKSKKAEKLDKAVDAFKRAIARNGENLFAYAGLVRVYSAQGKLDDAGAAMKVINEKDSNFVTGIVAHGILLQAKNKHEDAIQEFKRALEYNKNMPRVHYLLARSYEKVKDMDSAISSLKESFKQLATTIQLNMAQE